MRLRKMPLKKQGKKARDAKRHGVRKLEGLTPKKGPPTINKWQGLPNGSILLTYTLFMTASLNPSLLEVKIASAKLLIPFFS